MSDPRNVRNCKNEIDKLNTFPVGVYYEDARYFNGELVFQRLVGVFQTIYS